jgi:hypothetical protein
VPRYAPLPIVSIDPRNEAALVQAASQRVYDASNQTLNDFSAGNPLAALIEGQAFAQGEFLFWANSLPQSILVEWIGPFLGAQRRLGTAATALLTVSITPSDTVVTIPAGTAFVSDANITGGQSYTYITYYDNTIPPGETQIEFPVYSQYVGSQYNAPANSITTISAVGVNVTSVTNLRPAVGGSDVETFQAVQERFFPLIRAKNPVSAEDWSDFFINLYGVGTQTSVQPNRPSQRAYNYLTDYLLPNGQVSFFVLGPGGVELTADQLDRGQNVINFSLPVENQGHLYPITLSQVQFNITCEIDANGAYGGNPRSSSLNFRDRLFSILQPGNVFPANNDPSVSDVDAAFYTTFDDNERFVNPKITSSKAYNTPPGFDVASATYTQVYAFEPSEFLLNLNDLVYTTLPISVFYPVVQSFTPYSSDKKKQTVYGNLKLAQIEFLVPGVYTQGQVVLWKDGTGADNQLHVILQNLTVGSSGDIARLIADGQISAAKTYSAWTVNSSYSNLVSGLYDPQIVEYDYAPNEFIPTDNLTIPQNLRPGTFVWVVNNTFTLGPSTDDLTGAATAGILGNPITPQELVPGTSYTFGTWVYTPQVGSGPDPVADPYFNYVDLTKGVVNKYAYVVRSFTYQPGPNQTVSEYFDEIALQGIITEIVAQNADQGLPIYKYKPRFPMGTYLEYRADYLSDPSYYIAAEYFTPNSTSIGDLVSEGLVLPLAINPVQEAQVLTYFASSTAIPSTRMFTFFKGDRTLFRQGVALRQYTATTNVNPLFQFDIYLQNGIFVSSEDLPLATIALNLSSAVENQTYYSIADFQTSDYIPFFNPAYQNYAEDTIVSEDGRNYYRVMKAFTPNATVTNWTNSEVVNTARIEEYEGNLLRYVDEYLCEESILSQLGRDISAIKLGAAQVTLIPRNQGRFPNSRQQQVFVWENTSTLTETPQLSWFSGTAYPYNPPNYGTGTLKL